MRHDVMAVRVFPARVPSVAIVAMLVAQPQTASRWGSCACDSTRDSGALIGPCGTPRPARIKSEDKLRRPPLG
jgi:hypothetical protein